MADEEEIEKTLYWLIGWSEFLNRKSSIQAVIVNDEPNAALKKMQAMNAEKRLVTSGYFILNLSDMCEKQNLELNNPLQIEIPAEDDSKDLSNDKSDDIEQTE